jgi:signal transduction histidine kinase
MANQPFLPIGLPREASNNDQLDERVGLHLLEALDALDAVYKSAAFFADLGNQGALAEHTLTRCLDAARSTRGVLLLVDGDRLAVFGDRDDAYRCFVPGALARPELLQQPLLCNGDDAAPLLRPDAARQNVLSCPMLAGERPLGLVVMLAPASSPFSSADAKLVGAVVSQAAIALSRAQRHREAELERQKLRLVVQNHQDGIAVLDAKGATTLCNPNARALLGTDDVLAGLTAADATLTLDALTSGPVVREVSPAGDAARVLSIGSRVVRDADHAVSDVVVTVRDLSRQRREERLNRNFVSLISHKLRTPLTALGCAIAMLEASPPEEQPSLLLEMNHRMHDLAALVDRLFDFTDLLEGAHGKGGGGDLRAVRDELLPLLAQRPETATAQILWDLAPDACAVTVPAGRLRLLLLNLIDNACKFSVDDHPWVRIAAAVRGATVRIDVEDRGPGIPATAHTSVLESFGQLDEEFTGNVPGAGIGLAMVREIVRRAGGSIELHAAEPNGCVFTIVLPRGGADPGAGGAA